MIFQRLLVARNCFRPDTSCLTILAIKRGLLRNFAKKFKDCHFMGHSGTDLKFQLQLNSKSSKLSLRSLSKNMLKVPILDLKKRSHFSNFALY